MSKEPEIADDERGKFSFMKVIFSKVFIYDNRANIVKKNLQKKKGNFI